MDYHKFKYFTKHSYFSLGSKITSIEMKLDDNDIFSADIIAQNISNKLSDSSVKVEN